LRDQKAIALGAVYYFTEALAVRAGLLYGKSNVQKKYTIVNFGSGFNVPLAAWSCGASYTLGCWDYAFSLVYGVKNTIKGKPLPALFGPFQGGKVDLTWEYATFAAQIGRSF